MKMNWAFNPFSHLRASEENDLQRFTFLTTENHKILKTFITWSHTAPGGCSYLVVGEKGAGKTMTLFWLKSLTDTAHQILKDKMIKTIYVPRIANINMNALVAGLGFKDTKELTKYFSTLNHKAYLFIDIPDSESTRAYQHFVDFLEDLMKDFPFLDFVIAVNDETKDWIDKKFSLVLGKFNPVKLQKFTDAECAALIETRLESVGVRKNIFTQGAMKLINQAAHGVPRNILIASELCCRKFEESNETQIDEELVIASLNNGNSILPAYIQAVLADQVDDEAVKQQIIRIYNIIADQFNGCVEKELDLHKAMAATMSHVTITKYLKLMKKIEIINIEKSRTDRWTNTIRTAVNGTPN